MIATDEPQEITSTIKTSYFLRATSKQPATRLPVKLPVGFSAGQPSVTQGERAQPQNPLFRAKRLTLRLARFFPALVENLFCKLPGRRSVLGKSLRSHHMKDEREKHWKQKFISSSSSLVPRETIFSVQNRFVPAQIDSTLPYQAKLLAKFERFSVFFITQDKIYPLTVNMLLGRRLTKLLFYNGR